MPTLYLHWMLTKCLKHNHRKPNSSSLSYVTIPPFPLLRPKLLQRCSFSFSQTLHDGYMLPASLSVCSTSRAVILVQATLLPCLGYFNDLLMILPDCSQLPSLLPHSSVSTQQPKGLFEMKQHHVNPLFRILQWLPISPRVKAEVLTKSYTATQMQPHMLLHHSPAHPFYSSLHTGLPALPPEQQTHPHLVSYPHVVCVFYLLSPIR